MMNQNVGSLDKTIRIAIAGALILLYFTSVLTST
ncbi:MAG: YgaP-like transmembrane domain, partial [bacterium]